MPATLTLEDYLDALSMATARLHEESREAGLDAALVTCPEWSMLDLVAHQGTIHRWATANLRGQRHIDTEAIEAEGLQVADPGAWLMRGEEVLEGVLRSAPADLDVPFILRDAGPAREAWARRQAHETVIHAVDALSGQLGGVPSADDVDLEAEFAADGIDELLCGFLPRRRSTMRTRRPVTVLVAADDTGDAWTVRLSSEPAEVTRGTTGAPVESTWSGSALELYLGLWNRGRQIHQDGLDVLPAWRARMTVTWS